MWPCWSPCVDQSDRKIEYISTHLRTALSQASHCLYVKHTLNERKRYASLSRHQGNGKINDDRWLPSLINTPIFSRHSKHILYRNQRTIVMLHSFFRFAVLLVIFLTSTLTLDFSLLMKIFLSHLHGLFHDFRRTYQCGRDVLQNDSLFLTTRLAPYYNLPFYDSVCHNIFIT